MNDEGLGSWIERRRLRSPNDVAIVCDDERFTYAQFADRAGAVAALLRSLGVAKGERVAYFGENSPDLIAVLFGCALCGAVFVPVNTRLAAPEIAHVVRDSGARVLIHDGGMGERLDAVTAECELDSVIQTGDAKGGLNALLAGVDPTPVPAGVALTDPAAIIYTSGTTGRAKGAVLTHRNFTWVALNCIIDYDVTSSDIALMISPLFHVASLGMGALPILLNGGTLVVERGFEPGRALAQIERHGITMLSGVPTTFQLMCDHPDWDATDLTSLRKLTCGGAPAAARVMEAYEQRGLRFSQGYGMTEASPGVTALSPAMTLEKQGSVGLPHFFTHLRITDKAGAEVPAGTVGEIQISGPNVFSGYHGLPEANAAAFTDDGWFKSGDLGYVDDDGYLFIAGRAKDMIISGAENIYPAEVEAVITEMAEVTGVAVIGMPDDKWGEVPWAVLTLREGATMDEDTLRGYLDGRLARYKLPKRVVVVESLPRTASGKVKKGELRESLAAESGG